MPLLFFPGRGNCLNSPSAAAHIRPGLEFTDGERPEGRHCPVGKVGIIDDIGLVKGRAEDRGMGYLATNATADTTVDNSGHGIFSKGVGIVLDGQ